MRISLAKNDWDKAYHDLKTLEVGRRNLYPNGSFEEFELGSNPDGSRSNMEVYEVTDEKSYMGKKSLKVKANNNTNGYARITPYSVNDETWLHLKKGQNIVVSMYLFPTEIYSQHMHIGINGDSGASIFRYTVHRESLNINEWNKVHAYITVPNTGDYWLFIQYMDRITYVDGVKIEIGDSPSPYTPHPDDIKAHPFIADVAEMSYKNKTNREEVKELSNAITALGGVI